MLNKSVDKDIKRRAIARGLASVDDHVTHKALEASDLEVVRDEREGDNGDYFEFRAIANTASIDLDDEVVVPEGGDPKFFFKFRTIYLNHDVSMPVGTLRSAVLREGRGWEIKCTLLSRTSIARDARELVREGLIRGVSIGFVAHDYGPLSKSERKQYGDASNIIRRWRWLETSITPMPCNPDALIQARSKGVITPETLAVVLGDEPGRGIVLG